MSRNTENRQSGGVGVPLVDHAQASEPADPVGGASEEDPFRMLNEWKRVYSHGYRVFDQRQLRALRDFSNRS